MSIVPAVSVGDTVHAENRPASVTTSTLPSTNGCERSIARRLSDGSTQRTLVNNRSRTVNSLHVSLPSTVYPAHSPSNRYDPGST